MPSVRSSKEGRELQSSLYVGTFRIITSDWSKYKHSLGTQQLLLDMVTSVPGIISHSYRYPTSLVNEFFVLLGNILEGQTGPHIDHIVQELSCNPFSPRISTGPLPSRRWKVSPPRGHHAHNFLFGPSVLCSGHLLSIYFPLCHSVFLYDVDWRLRRGSRIILVFGSGACQHEPYLGPLGRPYQ